LKQTSGKFLAKKPRWDRDEEEEAEEEAEGELEAEVEAEMLGMIAKHFLVAGRYDKVYSLAAFKYSGIPRFYSSPPEHMKDSVPHG